MSRGDELELRRRFAEARDLDAASAPSFASVRRRTPPSSRKGRTARLVPAAVLAAAAVAAAAVITIAPRTPSPSAVDAIAQASELASWTAPSDAWLSLSGLEIPASIPPLSPSSVVLPETTTTAAATGELQ